MDEEKIIDPFHITGIPMKIDEMRASSPYLDAYLSAKSEDFQEAADRIEALEAALRKIASCQSHCKGDVVDIARTALGIAMPEKA